MTVQAIDELVRREAKMLPFIRRVEVTSDGKTALLYGQDRELDHWRVVAELSVRLRGIVGDGDFSVRFVPAELA